ncbi:erg4/erg24 family protein [Tieghemostelium lacteum]|uniref:Delta(14)-sterol reductase n=1 Tax=Tieghemostelium lacteum TaxID=361077 RepID=A0A151ZFY6_TIELA|nr:erg4/erg24 family protein [Tieghemostelium lacteum]|eukprot:KYQ92892.1 erg4/erg24 family protein [Tieghemostelium lacteum]
MEPLPFDSTFSISSLPGLLTSWTRPTYESVAIFGGFILFLGIGSHLIPGRKVQGQPLIHDPTKRLTYKTNGLSLFFALIAFYYFGSVHLKWFEPTLVYDHFGSIWTTVNIFATALTIYLFITGISSGRGKRHGNLLHDLFLGVELNPRMFGLDLKFFSLRPALMGWIMVNFSLAAQEIKVYGSLSTSMLLYQIFTFIYAFDYFFFEEYMLSTWDIIAENWGFMLIWGDYVWITFAFAVQPWFLLYNRFDLTPIQMLVISIIFAVGFYVFRVANAQKHQFKTNPRALIWGKPPQTINGKLLVSGFWGILRKPNYLGDWIVAFSFSFPCLFNSPIVYLYPMYLVILNSHRQWRDHIKCSKKYGKVWDEYCKRVPYVVIPYVI